MSLVALISCIYVSISLTIIERVPRIIVPVEDHRFNGRSTANNMCTAHMILVIRSPQRP